MPRPGPRRDWYHGTRKGFTRNGVVFPRSFHGGEGTTAPLSSGGSLPADAVDHVYVTDDPGLAWVYAWHAPGRGRPKVVVVEPWSAPESDPENPQGYRCDAATVVAVLHEPTVTEQEARTGWSKENA